MKNLIIILSFFSFSACAVAQQQQPQIIPQPVSVKQGKGEFVLRSNIPLVVSNKEDRKAAEFFNDYLHQTYGFRLPAGECGPEGCITISTKSASTNRDGYTLNVNQTGVILEGETHAGTFHGIQTLIQLLSTDGKENYIPIPFVSINDYPRFKYRGMHLDVARHYFPVSFIKKYIDYLALHKLNYFHWHLTDDQGWRIEIKKFPELTTIGAWRNGTIIGRYPGIGNDNLRYGGFYTQEEVKEVVQYAADRHITVIPEIEMPGHASAAIAAYPWLSCFPDEPTLIPAHPSIASQNSPGKHVQETWGVFEDVFCAGKDSTFLFLQAVLDEVIPLFPAPYIHLGGDECPKANWKRCTNCQKRIKALRLKDEHELQSYFVQRMEKYVNSKGKTIIGWDEILEGGLAPNAIVMSWRGEKGGIEAAKQNHEVIMTPQKPLYFDHTQTKNEDSVVIGGFNPIEAVYAYDPVPKDLPASKEKYILGGQANLWAEYIKNESKVEYMIFPRMSALSEVLWTLKEKRDWKDFESRLLQQFKRYQLWKANYSQAYFELQSALVPTEDYSGIAWEVTNKFPSPVYNFFERQILSTPDSIPVYDIADPSVILHWHLTPVRYSLIQFNKNRQMIEHSSTPAVLYIDSSGTYKVESKNLRSYPGSGLHLLRNKDLPESSLEVTISFNKATGKKTSITKKPNERYPGQGGAFGLVNGIYSNKGLSHPDWLGWIGDDMEATIDLGSVQEIDSVRMHTIEQTGSWVYRPAYVEVFLSNDGKQFTSAGRTTEFVRDTLTMAWMPLRFKEKKSARFVRVIAKNYGTIPAGNPGAGSKAWVFCDEIQVN